MMAQKRGAIRYGVVGVGHIAQVAMLPAFKHAARNSQLAALVSDDATKRRVIGQEYRVETFGYDDYDACLERVDAVYIALPNSLHAEYTIRAAQAGVHVLCEKPMAVTSRDCQAMIDACRRNRVKLMIAYRLHFEEATLGIIDLVRTGRIGDPKFFNSSFSMTVRKGNIRTKARAGRRHVVRHRRLLHQRRAPSVSRRTDRSDRPSRSTAAPARSRRSTKPPARY